MNAFENWFFTFFSGDRHAAYQLINLCSLLFIVFPISRTVCRVVNSRKYAIRMRMMLTIWCGQFLDLEHIWHLASHGERTILRLGLIILGRNLTSLIMITISQGNSEQFAEHLFFFYLARGEATGSEAISKRGESWTQPLQVPNWKSAPEKKQYNNTIWISSTLRFPGYPCNNLGKIWRNKVYSSEKPRLDGDTIGGQSNQYLSWKSRWGLRTRVVLNTIMEFWSLGGFLFMITGLWKLYLFSHPYLLKWVAPCIYILFSSSYFLSDPSPIIIYPCQ